MNQTNSSLFQNVVQPQAKDAPNINDYNMLDPDMLSKNISIDEFDQFIDENIRKFQDKNVEASDE